MKYLIWKRLTFVLLLIACSHNASATVMYEYLVDGTLEPSGYISFKDSVASSTTGWSVSAGESLIDQLEGGLSGLTGYFFGSGFETAISGDLTATTDFGSLSGAELDFGSFSGLITFSGGSIMYGATWRIDPNLDEITSDYFVDGLGNPVTSYGDAAASVVPVPTAVWLFGSGLIGLIGLARRKANA